MRRGPAPRAAGVRGARIAALALLLLVEGCSPVYVAKAGLAQLRILGARRPNAEVVLDAATSPAVRSRLLLAMEARRFAATELGMRVEDVYTSYADLPSDTLSLVLSAAPRDALRSKTWWFPVVGRLPYRGYFDEEDAREEAEKLGREGYDVYLRPTAAFSTLGWFADPIPSSIMSRDPVAVVETVLHELAHVHLWTGSVQFNESYASFLGAAGAAAFFCTRDGGGPDTVWCRRARARWRDDQRFSRFLDGAVADLQALYGDPGLGTDEKVARREDVWAGHRERYLREVAPTLEASDFGGLVDRPLNNAVLLGRMRYYHRLYDFQALLEREGGDLARALEALVAGVRESPDPFRVLPGSS